MRAANFAGFPEEGNGFAVVGGCNAPECLQQDAIGDGMAALVVFEGRKGHAGRRQTPEGSTGGRGTRSKLRSIEVKV